MVEGYTDVIAMHQCGIENVVANSGTALSLRQIKLLRRFTQNITLLYDGDEAGIHAAMRGTDMLLAEGMTLKVLLLPDGDDPDSFARKHNATEYQAYLNDHQTDFIKFKTDLLLKEAQGDPIKLSRLINSIVHSISVIPDEITRSVYVKQSALMLGLEERTLAIAIAKEITKSKEEKQKQKEREQNGAIRNEETPPSIPVPDIHHIPQDTAVPFPVTEDIPPLSENDIPSAPPDVAPITSADIPVEPQVSTENTYLPQQQTNDMAFYRKELLLMQMVIRHGEKVMCYTEDEKPLSVAEYIHYALKEDDIKLHTQLHTMILEEAMAHIQEEGFCSERFFLNHSDNRISMLAFELCDDKYQLSKYHSRGQKITSEEERLMELVPHLIDDFKLAIIKEDLKQILLKLRNPAILSHQEEYMKIMKHYKELKDIECILSKERGDRVIS
jgi:DNA primase